MDKTKILFICLGNICRSPAANAIMQKYVDEAGLTDKFYINSAGIGPWHVGQLPDKRMRQHGAKRGYNIDHIARQFNSKHDFDDFDYIVVMDDENYKNICWQAHNDEERKKVIRMADYLIKYKGRHDSCPKDTDDCARQSSSLALLSLARQSPTHTMAVTQTLNLPLTSLRTAAVEYLIQ